MMPPHEYTDKERLINFIKKFVPDDFEIKHISVTFTDDNNACISLSNDVFVNDD